jgi:hypothetical protein
MTHLFNSRRRCVPSLGSQARLGQEHTGDLQKECCTNRGESAGWLTLTGLLFGGIVYGYIRHPPGFLGPLLFFVLLGPTSSVIPIKTQTMAEHRAYLPSAALIIPAVAAAWCVARERCGLSQRSCFLATVMIALVLGYSTAARNRDLSTT